MLEHSNYAFFTTMNFRFFLGGVRPAVGLVPVSDTRNLTSHRKLWGVLHMADAIRVPLKKLLLPTLFEKLSVSASV